MTKGGVILNDRQKQIRDKGFSAQFGKIKNSNKILEDAILDLQSLKAS